MPPMTKNPPACTRSCRASTRNRSARLSPSTSGRRRPAVHSARSIRTQTQPTTSAAAVEARKRASTMSGRPGNATDVATTTTGLIAGADSRNASAAAGGTPRAINPRATGTDEHSQPGSTTPASPATGTAAAGRRGSTRVNTDAGTNTDRAVLSATPSTRNGSACTQIATNTVAHVRIAGDSNSPARNYCPSTTTSRIPVSTVVDDGRRPATPGRRAGAAGRTVTGTWFQTDRHHRGPVARPVDNPTGTAADFA